MIEITPTMWAKVRARMGFPAGEVLYPWLEGVLRDVLDEVDETYRISDARHLIKIDDEGFTVQHPLSCRPNLFSCPWGSPHRHDIADLNFRAEYGPHGVYVGISGPVRPGSDMLRLTVGDEVDGDA